MRGAFGVTLWKSGDYDAVFAPRRTSGASGLADPPRPFVFRAARLEGRAFRPGDEFDFDVHWFGQREAVSFDAWDAAEMTESTAEDIRVDLTQRRPAECVRVRFLTPTELKAGGHLARTPEFAILFARARDRVSTLRALYGAGPLDIDFRAMRERAAAIRMTRCDLHWHEVERRSGRTGQVHPIGGFTGFAEYRGDVSEFLPYLQAARYTGVGRQTVWGKGEIYFDTC